MENTKLIKLTIPISEETISKLKVGDSCLLSGVLVTARDVAHKYIVENFINKDPMGDDKKIFDKLYGYLNQGVIYHCGPIIREENSIYNVVAAGPTTSIREEPYQADVIKLFGLRGVIGKGGMGDKTLKGCEDNKAVYFHAVGGAAVLIGQCVKEVLSVEKLDFGTPEAFWIVKVEDFPCIVTMDSHGKSLHKEVLSNSKEKLNKLLFQ